ncbi:UNVERIFIED_CONTAM: putative inorganic phosphate transporter 1-9 [Sesamum calycinum]|uniref:Inorganic phosphate transporter 1-9 n=1 Tax=Sesamum calycinum TaxID=2727403 RepID=A0AAW2LAI4_9LAMI
MAADIDGRGGAGRADVLLADDDAGDCQATKDMQKVLLVSLSQIHKLQEEEQQEGFQNNISPPSNNYSLLSKEFLRRHGRDLFACAATWFLVDIVFYSSNLFQSQIYHGYLPDQGNVNAFQEAFHVAKLQAIIAICSTIPGYYVTVCLIDRIGRVKIQMMGFLFMGLGLLAIGIPYNVYWHDNTNIGFMILYSLTFFFSNFGPNTTTFIVPAELFPARFRSTCHGLSGSAGKIGAIIGSIGYLWASLSEREDGYGKGIGMTASLVVLGGVCVVGTVITHLFTLETFVFVEKSYIDPTALNCRLSEWYLRLKKLEFGAVRIDFSVEDVMLIFSISLSSSMS